MLHDRMNYSSPDSEETTVAQQEQDQPKLYSKRLILVFSILFSTIFAAALLTANLKSLGKRAAAGWVLIFAIVYLIATALVMQAYQLSPGLTPIANVIGAAILNEFFWNKYIGPETGYQKKNWLKPTALSIGIVLVLFLIMMAVA